MPGQPVVLDSFGGLVTTARPEDLPEGASPRNNDVDYVVGRFIQRPGLQDVYSYPTESFGPLGAGSAVDVDTEGVPWSNPGNILLQDGNYTTCALGAPYAITATQGIQRGWPPFILSTLVVTFTADVSALIGEQFTFFGLTNATWLNGQTLSTLGLYLGNPNQMEFNVFLLGHLFPGNYGPTPDTGAANLNGSTLISDDLELAGFGFAIPSTSSISGIMVNVKGFGAGITLNAQLLQGGLPAGEIKSLALPSTGSFISFGGSADYWGTRWDYSSIDSPGFGVHLWVNADSPLTPSLDYADIVVYVLPSSSNFNGIASENLNGTDQVTLALDANGLTWKEDVSSNPGQLAIASVIPAVVPGSYLKGIDANGVAFMAYSDLTQGTSQPMQYNGAWCDRITQVGPGKAPTFTPQQTTSSIFPITSITQAAAVSDVYSYFLQSSGPGSTTPGNVVTFYYQDSTGGGANADLVAAWATGQPVFMYVSFTGTPVTFGPQVVQVTSIGEASPPNQPRQFYYFTFVVSGSAYTYYQGSGHPGYTANFERSLATLNMGAPVPGLAVGSQVTIAGSSVASYDGAWTITQALNSGQMQITSTAVSGGVATYNYSVQSGVAPTAGELVTITNTTNALGQLNLTNATIDSASGGNTGYFTILVSITTTFGSSSEPTNAVATTAGTIFAFDPGAALVGSSTNPIFGTGTGGTLTFSNAISNTITPGVKQGSVFFITRNGAVTRPAPPTTFTVPTNCGALLASAVPVGPPNVVARGITFTESGQNEVPGANFYYYDTAQSYYVNGVTLKSDALIIPDNTTTSATFSFSDSVLLASDEIDVPGNDYFNLIELGNPAWMFQYADRMLYGLCQTKVQNFLNLSFDGGYLPVASPQLPLPTGWSSIATGTMGLVPSLDFGNAFRITNTTASPLTNATVLYQPAFQDYLNVNIIQPNTLYSVRVKARSLAANAQVITIQLSSYANNAFAPALFGLALFAFDQGAYQIQTATLITGNGLATVPSALQLAIGVSALAIGAGVEIDRVEIFPTNRPAETTTIWVSYANKFESVDINTGQLGVGADNPQAATGAFELLEQLYIEKSKSLSVTQDSPNYEPNNWQVRQASDRAGAVGPNAFDEGEEFTISATRNGVYYFDGGKPQPISRELQNSAAGLNIWESINWVAGASIWVRNDLKNRRLMIGIPMNTPNPWLPNAAAATPTSPNIILMCNYTGCPTGAEMAEMAEVHVTMFGDLKALDMRRKWSLWQVPCPVAEPVLRADGFSNPLFLCNGNASEKIYQFIPGAADGSGQNTDDGAPINWSYCTYPFVKAKQGQAIQGLGALRKIWYYLTVTMEGIGKVAGKLYSNSLGALPRNTYTIPLPFTLSSPQQYDHERVLEIGGQRLFVEFTSVGSGGYAEVGPILLDGEMDKVSPHRGVSS